MNHEIMRSEGQRRIRSGRVNHLGFPYSIVYSYMNCDLSPIDVGHPFPSNQSHIIQQQVFFPSVLNIYKTNEHNMDYKIKERKYCNWNQVPCTVCSGFTMRKCGKSRNKQHVKFLVKTFKLLQITDSGTSRKRKWYVGSGIATDLFGLLLQSPL